ncbi:MAG: AAA family ATPase [bacterium]|nr:AAA family ATPase [bacterium]
MAGLPIGAEIIGHRATLDALGAEAVSPVHSYLFAGPSGVGKATVALAFAAALVSRSEAGRDRVTRKSHPDVVMIGPEGRAGFGVGQSRQAITAASLRPVEANRKVFILDEASTMTEAAANALLKTLEEPPPRTVFVLIAESADDLPPTVASRCRLVHFGRVPEGELAVALAQRGADADRATMIARIAGGRPGLALEMAKGEKAAAFRQSWLAVPGRLPAQPGHGFRLAEEMLKAHEPLLEEIKTRRDREIKALKSRGLPVPKALRDSYDRALRRTGMSLLVAGLDMLASWYLDAASVQHGGPVRNPDVPRTELAKVPARPAARSAELVIDAGVQLRRNQRPRLVLTWLFNRLADGAQP